MIEALSWIVFGLMLCNLGFLFALVRTTAWPQLKGLRRWTLSVAAFLTSIGLLTLLSFVLMPRVLST